jgi:hypothetical protein
MKLMAPSEKEQREMTKQADENSQKPMSRDSTGHLSRKRSRYAIPTTRKANPDISVKGQVWVDTGQAGFFDADEARDHSSGWADHGVTCLSGYGDGAYPCFVARDGAKAVAACIVFIS